MVLEGFEVLVLHSRKTPPDSVSQCVTLQAGALQQLQLLFTPEQWQVLTTRQGGKVASPMACSRDGCDNNVIMELLEWWVVECKHMVVQAPAVGLSL